MRVRGIRTQVSSPKSFDSKTALLWAITCLSLPIGGYVAWLVVGPIDEAWVAVAAGAIAGALIGVGQWLALRRVWVDMRWILATSIGMAVGLGVTEPALGYGTSVGDLAALGAITGLVVGAAQFPLLAQGPLSRGSLAASAIWVPVTAALWALGWTVTTSIGVDVEQRWAVFGASGVIPLAALSALALWLLARNAARSSDALAA